MADRVGHAIDSDHFPFFRNAVAVVGHLDFLAEGQDRVGLRGVGHAQTIPCQLDSATIKQAIVKIAILGGWIALS